MVLDGGRMKFVGDTRAAVVNYKRAMNEHRAGRHSVIAGRRPSQTHEQKQEVEIINVEFFDGRGKSTTQFVTGQVMAIRITFCSHRKINEPVFGLGIWRSDGVYMTGLNTYLDEYSIDQIHGTGTLEVRFHALNLLDGEYLVTVGILQRGSLGFYALENHKYRFFVHSVNNDQGAMYLEHQWKLMLKDSYKNTARAKQR
jgi:hypothetical protein